MITTRFAALIVVLVAAAAPAVGHAGDWEVIAQRDGIVVSRRFVNDRRLPEVRAQGEVAGTPYEILAVLLDVPGYREWVPDCAEATLLHRSGPWRSLIYSRTELPWPVLDRETVIDQEVAFIRPPFLVKVTFQAVDAPEVAHARGTVRTHYAVGSYTIEATDGGRSRVSYQVDADPGGAVPGWLIRTQSRRNPLETLTGLRLRVASTRGQYREQIARFPAG